MRCAIVTGLVVSLFCLALLARESAADHDYPKVVNLYYQSIELEDCDLLSGWDMLVLGSSVQATNPELIDTLRSKNPDIKILAYFPAVFVWDDYAAMYPAAAEWGHKVDQCDWQLRDTKGNPVGTEGYLWFNNFSTKCPPDEDGRRIGEWLADHISTSILSTGLWDGILIDGLFTSPDWLNNWDAFFIDPPATTDIDRNGQADDPDSAYIWWKTEVESFLVGLRDNIGHSFILIGNDNNYMWDYLNGGIRENFPNMHGGWHSNMFGEHGYMTQCDQYLTAPTRCPLMVPYWLDDDNTRHEPDRTGSYERFLRFTLTSALLGDGYYSLASRDPCLWWEDYYDLDLGAPTSDAYLDSIWTDIYSCYRPVWRREYGNATVLCNPGPEWVILEDGTWLAPEDGHIETYSIPPGLDIGVIRQGSERTFDQKDTFLRYEASISNPSEHSAFVHVWATLSRNGETVASSNPRRFLIGAEGSDVEALQIRTNPSPGAGTYTPAPPAAGPDLAAVASDTMIVERIISRAKEPITHTDTGGLPTLAVYPEPVVSASSIRLELRGTRQTNEQRTAISLYDVRGRLVNRVFDGLLEPGQVLQTRLQAAGHRPLSPGVYILHAEIEHQHLTRKIVVVR